MSPAFSVIIVNYNSGDRLSRCLDHLRQQNCQDFETIVVDNASNDGSEAAAMSAEKVNLIQAGSNIGFAAANNLAARDAQGDWLAFLNPDAYAAPDWLEEAARGVKRYPEADAFGSTQLDAADASRIDGAGDAFHAFGVPYRGHHGWPVDMLPPEGECFAPCAAASFMRASTFQELGGFDEDFFCYVEDVDLGFRLRLAGGRAIQLHGAVIRHEGSGLTGRDSAFTVYHGHRNRIWTYLLNMPLPLLIATAPFHLLANFYLFFRFLIAGRGGAYADAMRDAVKKMPEMWRRREARQKERKASTLQIASALTWSPLKLMKKEADVRPRA